MANNPFEIPQNLRAVSEQSLQQAHDAYEQFTDMVTRTMDAWLGVLPASPMTAGFKDVQGHIMEFAKDNAEAAFTFAGRVSNAQNVQDIMTVQTQFLQDRMQSFVTQTQRLYGLIQEALQKSDGAAVGAALGMAPSTPLVTASKVTIFKDVRDSAVAMAKTNAELAFALVEKMGKVQNIQELLTLQTQFAQEQMQTFVAQTEELQRRIREALQRSARS